MSFGELAGQGWLQAGELGLAFVLSALIGLEREIRQKSAGLRTHTLVGLSAALIMLISKYGFADVLAQDRVVLDPSRIAAQVVSGIGFIGGGLIFVRRDSVRGLTTAAIVWLTASVGMACGAGLPVLALAATAGHFVVVLGFPHIVLRLPKSRWTPSVLQMSYEDGREILRDVLLVCTQHDFAVSRLRVQRASPQAALPEAAELSTWAAGWTKTRPSRGRRNHGSHTMPGLKGRSRLWSWKFRGRDRSPSSRHGLPIYPVWWQSTPGTGMCLPTDDVDWFTHSDQAASAASSVLPSRSTISSTCAALTM